MKINFIESDFLKLAQMPLDRKKALINFSDSDFASIRDNLIKYVKAAYPLDYNYFIESDLGMMFIELIAYMGAVLSMKADMLANENFLATAKQRASVRKLLELIGVRLKGPISSAGDARLDFSQVPGSNTFSGLATTTPVVIAPENRVFSLVSPEDGASVSYTLYKVVNGSVDTANVNSEILLYPVLEADNAAKTVFTNLVLQEGAFVRETGDFAATESLKSIRLSQGPVVEGSVQVFITDFSIETSGVYKQVDNIFFASGTTDKVFQINYDEDYNAQVMFGDGVFGALPSDNASYVVTYRVGGGTRGNLPKNSINTNITASLLSVTGSPVLKNVSELAGGANAETVEHAKKYAPYTFRRQDRLVTLNDYKTFANTFISNFGIAGKANAVTRNAYYSANTIDIYVLEKASDFQLQKATPQFKTDLLNAINEKKMATDEIVIVDGLIRTLDLFVTIKINKELKQQEEEIKANVRDAVLNFMNMDNREFGQPLSISELNRVMFEVDDVIFSSVDNLTQDILVDFNEIIQLNNLTIKVDYLS